MPLGIARHNSLSRISPGAPVIPTRTPKWITVYNQTEIDTAFSAVGSSSVTFDGSGDYMVVFNASDLNFGTADWTIEFWVRFEDLASSRGIISDLTTSEATTDAIGITAKSGGDVGLYHQGTLIVGESTSNLSADTWYHMAFTRSSGNWYYHRGGVLIDSNTTDTSLNANFNKGVANQTVIGRYRPVLQQLYGWLDELRISDTARYSTSSFTPSTTAYTNDANTLLLIHAEGADGSKAILDDAGPQTLAYTPSTSAFTDDSSNELLLHMDGSAGGTSFSDDNSSGRTAKTLTANGVTTETAQKVFGTASMLAEDTAADALNVTPTNNLIRWYETDFTVEAWIYPTEYQDLDRASYGGIFAPKVIGNMNRTTSANYWSFGPNSRGGLSWYIWDPSIGSRGNNTISSMIVLNQWQHIAFTFDFSTETVALYHQGTKYSEFTVPNFANVASSTGTDFCVGGYDNEGFPGYIDEVRVSRGTMRY